MLSIKMSSPDLTENEALAVAQVLRGTSLSIGPHVESFERSLGRFVEARHAIAVNSGTSGLHLAVIAAGIGDRNLVVTTPFSFIASANCVLYEHGLPVFVDVEPETGNIDPRLAAYVVDDLMDGRRLDWCPQAIRDHMKSGRDLKAILPVHAFGQPCDMDPILETARRHGLHTIEDACEALGAKYKDRHAGTLGGTGVFAFYPNKQMTTGEGGMLVTNDPEWDRLFRSLRNQGRDIFDAWLNHTRLGYNYRLDEMSAALGLAQVGRLDDLLDKRNRVACWYNQRLQNQELLRIPWIALTTTYMSWFVYVIRILLPASRNAVMVELKKQGIPSRPYFTPIHLQPFYANRFGYRRGDYPITEELGDTSLALPFSSVMTEAEVDFVCSHLFGILKSKAGQCDAQNAYTGTD
jgi:dTDP-4-amino-4,6-dideoxygalactose transaminase